MRIVPCLWCSREIRNPRKNRLYCSDTCRIRGWSSGLGKTSKPCFYCGVPATGIDHLPPRSVRPTLIAQGIKRWPFEEIDSCQECNSISAARPPWDKEGRKRKIKKLLAKRYRKFLRIPEWSDAEISRMGDRMKDFIIAGRIIAELCKKRLKW